MFRFKNEQTIVNVAGVRFGGQPGELPTVLCGTIFYQGHRIVEDDERGIFDRAAAERLVLRQSELSSETGCPFVLHIYARTVSALQKYLDFAEEVSSGPFIVDSAERSTRCLALSLLSELGYADKAIFNSISIATDDAEARALLENEVDSAIILAYNPGEPGVEGAMRILENGGLVRDEGLIPLSKRLGISNILIDPGVVPMGSGAGSSLRFSVVAKSRLGLPVGSGIHNAVSSWQWLKDRMKSNRSCCDAAAACMQLAMGGDFLLYGPIESGEVIFPAAAMADILVAEAVRDLEVYPEATHPIFRLV